MGLCGQDSSGRPGAGWKMRQGKATCVDGTGKKAPIRSAAEGTYALGRSWPGDFRDPWSLEAGS